MVRSIGNFELILTGTLIVYFLHSEFGAQGVIMFLGISEVHVFILGTQNCLVTIISSHVTSWMRLELKSFGASVVALGFLFRVVTKKFKLPQYFSWYHFLRKNEIRNYFN